MKSCTIFPGLVLLALLLLALTMAEAFGGGLRQQQHMQQREDNDHVSVPPRLLFPRGLSIKSQDGMPDVSLPTPGPPSPLASGDAPTRPPVAVSNPTRPPPPPTRIPTQPPTPPPPTRIPVQHPTLPPPTLPPPTNTATQPPTMPPPTYIPTQPPTLPPPTRAPTRPPTLPPPTRPLVQPPTLPPTQAPIPTVKIVKTRFILAPSANDLSTADLNRQLTRVNNVLSSTTFPPGELIRYVYHSKVNAIGELPNDDTGTLLNAVTNAEPVNPDYDVVLYLFRNNDDVYRRGRAFINLCLFGGKATTAVADVRSDAVVTHELLHTVGADHGALDCSSRDTLFTSSDLTEGLTPCNTELVGTKLSSYTCLEEQRR